MTSLVDRRLWLALLATPSSYLVSSALIGTLAVKLIGLSSITAGRTDLRAVLTACAPDVALLGALGALFVTCERIAVRRGLRPLKWAVRGFALFIAIFSLFNGAYLSVTGDQLTASIVTMGWQRLHDAYGILLEELRRRELQLAAGALLLLTLPWLSRRMLKGLSGVTSAPNPALPLALLSGCAGLAWLLIPAPSSLPLARLARNALLTTYTTWVRGSLQAMTEAGNASVLKLEPLIEPGTRQSPTSRFNVVIVMVESLRHDYASFHANARAQTPHLAALARRGAFSDSASTPVPHTSKALFAVHCGHMPFWQSELHEFSELVQAQCLPQLLRTEGYATGFFQSAIGAFEDRPRLVHRLGFELFEAWENIGGEPLGYLASDDLSLAPAFDRWLDRLPENRPFLATLLTSATHHPYRLPKAELDRLKAQGLDPNARPAEQRYHTLVERADDMLGNVLATLDRRGLRDHTLIVVLGDHGEGFGEKGVRQHDNNYYEESLRVPLVIAGPGVPTQRLADDVSLLDVTPTLLKLLGFDVIRRDAALYGRDALSRWPGQRTEYFSCFYDGVCFGFVRGQRKVVALPELQHAIGFDLKRDPEEKQALPVASDLPELNQLGELTRELQRFDQRPAVSDLRLPNGWFCAKNGFCTHPKTPPGMFFTPALPNQCVTVKASAVAGSQGYDHTLSLHNVCSGPTVCDVSSRVSSSPSQSVTLRPDESRELVLDRQARTAEIQYRMDCRFL